MSPCPRCGRELVDAAGLAAQAETLRAVVAGAVSLAQGSNELEGAYGGPYGLRRALLSQVLKAEGIALEHARAAACAAGTCHVGGQG